jgi:hypothetical protein
MDDPLHNDDPLHKLDKRGALTAVTLFTLVLAGMGFTVRASWAGSPSVGLVWALACLIVGIIAGFLFAIPRVPANDDPNAKESKSSSPGSGGKHGGLGINTNLEQVSDWLTKILVGLGLVEAKTLIAQLRNAGIYIGASLGRDGATIATGLIVYFLGLGFISGYLLTRIFVSPMLRRADDETGGWEETTRIAIDAEAQSKSAPELYDVLDAAYATLMDNRLKNKDVPQDLRKDVPRDVAIAILSELKKFRDNPRWNLNRRLHIQIGVFSRKTGNLEEGIRALTQFVERKREANQNDIHQAAALYNIACYKAVQAREERAAGRGEVAGRRQAEAIDCLEKSVALSPSNGVEARTDDDFRDLWENDQFKKVTAPASS